MVLAVALHGCATTTLPYTPAQQPWGARISADYAIMPGWLRVEVETDGRRLDDARIITEDATIGAHTIEYPPFRQNTTLGLGIGVGGGGWGSRGGVSVGSGLSVAAPVGEARAEGPTLLHFPLDSLGSPPWRLRIQLSGLGETDIVLRPRGDPPPAPARRQ
jgi:hypothetical protein